MNSVGTTATNSVLDARQNPAPVGTHSISWKKAFLLPLSNFYTFRGIGALLTEAPFGAIFCGFLVGLLFTGLISGAFLLPQTQHLMGIEAILGDQPAFEIVTDYLIDGMLFGIAGFMGLAGACLLMLPDAHRSGSPWRALILAAKSLMVQITLWAAICLSLILVYYIFAVLNSGTLRSVSDSLAALAFVLVGTSSFWIVMSVTQRLLRSATDGQAPAIVSMLCERCGYDISFADVNGVCSECAYPIKSSLVFGTRRRGIAWEKSEKLTDWISTAWTCLLRPGSFYERLLLRTRLAPALNFARINFALLGATAGSWLFLGIGISEGFRHVELMLIIGLFWACIIPLVGWATSRGVASLVGLLWFSKNWLRDGRWLAKVARYETVFIWVFCVFNGGLMTSFVIFGDWMEVVLSGALGLRPGFVPPEPLFVLACNGSLFLLWFYRYRIILRAIQWSNF